MYLKNRLKEVEIPLEDPFANDALDRKKYAEILTSVVNAYGHFGCVLALNGEWGSGKTTFVNMWKAHLEGLGYKAIYFNAWQSDYLEDPLVALVSELQVLNPDKSSISSVAANIGKIILATGSSVFKTVLKARFGFDSDVVKDAVNTATDIGMKSLEEYSEEKASFENFKTCLIGFIADNAEKDKPIVFFIDELDRCRPDYAVKVLERIKHLFDIPDIVFVLSVNKKQLGCAIQGFYGTTTFDAEDYLRRFIDISYELPMPDMKLYSEYLYKEYGFDMFFKSEERLQLFNKDNEPGELMATSSRLAEICQLDLRTQDRVFAICRVALESLNANNYLLPDVLYLLCLLKIKYNDVYNGIKAKAYTVQMLIDVIESTVLKNYSTTVKKNPYDKTIEFTIATFLVNYNNPLYGEVIDKDFIGKDSGNNDQTTFPFTVKRLNKERLNEGLNWVSKKAHGKYQMGLDFFLNRIDLLTPLRKN